MENNNLKKQFVAAVARDIEELFSPDYPILAITISVEPKRGRIKTTFFEGVNTPKELSEMSDKALDAFIRYLTTIKNDRISEQSKK